MSILVEDDRIIAIGPSNRIGVPETAQRISGTDRYLLPGLVDAHMHLWDSPEELLLYLAWGVTSVRSLDGTPEHVAWRDEVIAGDRIGPTIYTSGPILYGDETRWSEIVDTADAGRAIVADHIRHVPNASTEITTSTCDGSQVQALPSCIFLARQRVRRLQKAERLTRSADSSRPCGLSITEARKPA